MNQPSIPLSPIPADVRERIIQSAVDLYAQAGHEAFPTVDQVRRAARVDMNAASSVMREWRRQQTVKAAPVAVTIPEAVAQANTVALAALWSQAQALANESLRSAQASWETERGELDAMRQELAEAYETQAAEIERLNAQLVQQAEALERERTSAQDALQLAAEAERSAAVLVIQLEAANAAIVQAEARYELSDKNTQQARQAEQGARIAEQACQARLESAARELEAQRLELAETRAAAKCSGEEAAELRGRLAAFTERSGIESEARAAVVYASELPDQAAPEPRKKATPAKAKAGKQAKLDS
ncbi:DNA-binding protein (plasmid) [Candidatus Methylospira mobilis]|uniref:DNA-binding protein n=1 Tax=Candidatus Methylospira mobilis TaxID=1808979 RepID=UPI0028EFDFB0|nr:DNA-binding protein [Candidatus Methylospira mobilis]WNV06930.1 DNA-binding protein [Candidatus Methylospira mobilis]